MVSTWDHAERQQAEFLAGRQAVATETKSAVTRAAMAALTGFADRFTVFPDSGITELHCGRCAALGSDTPRWTVGYHPSLDVLIEQARAHDLAEHGG